MRMRWRVCGQRRAAERSRRRKGAARPWLERSSLGDRRADERADRLVVRPAAYGDQVDGALHLGLDQRPRDQLASMLLSPNSQLARLK